VIRQLTNIDRTYWQLYAARKELEVRQKQYELAQTQLAQAQRRVSAGDVAPIEVTRAEAGLAQRLEAIINAENTVLQQQREIKRIINTPDLPMESRTLLIPETEPDVTRYAFDGVQLADVAVDNRMEMLELELQLAQDYTNIESAKNQALPDIALDFQYSFPGVGTTLGSSAEQIRSGDFHRWSAGVSGNIQLGNERAKAGVQQAILRRLQRLSSKDARRLAIRQETLGAIDNAEASWQRILAARQSVLAAARTFEAEQRQFDAGSRTSTDVLDAASRLAEAQSSEIRAIADYQIAQVDLAFATGTVLGQGMIDWAPLDPRIGAPATYGQTPGDPTPPTLPFYVDPETRDAPTDPGTLREPN
jgi:outer membrane protein